MSVLEPDAEDFEATRAPLLEHLIEFRRRFMWSVVVFMACSGVCYLYAEQIYGLLVRPLAISFGGAEGKKLIYTNLAEAFLTYLSLAVFGGFVLSFPFIAAQVYRFVAPGLYKRERRVVVPYLFAAPVLFALGAALAYFIVMPAAWAFFVSFQNSGTAGGLPISLEARVGEYLSLSMQLLIGFGLAFQLPVILTLLARGGLTSSAALAKKRRIAIVAIVIAAALLTPPDVFSQLALAVPLYGLYELSIVACRMVERKKTETLPVPHSA